MKKGLILFPRSTAAYRPTAFRWWLDEARACSLDARIAFFEDFDIMLPRERQDFVVMRGYHRRLSQHFENQGTRVFSPWAAMERSRDKSLTAGCLREASVPTPDCTPWQRGLTFHDAAERFGCPLVVKQINGSRGENVYLAASPEEFAAAVDACCGQALLQRYVAESHGRDVRVWVVGDKAVGAVLRSSADKFVSNYSQGGSAAPFVLDAEAASMAVAASRAVGLDFAGVDLLLDGSGGYTVCEVNGNAGFRTLSATSDINIIRIFMQYVHDNVNR